MGSGTVHSHHVQGSTLKETEFNIAKLNRSTTKATENLELNCFVVFNEICMFLSPFSSTLLAKISVGSPGEIQIFLLLLVLNCWNYKHA